MCVTGPWVSGLRVPGLPVAGGAVWELFGSRAPFLAGMGIVFISLVLTQFMRAPSKPLPVVIRA